MIDFERLKHLRSQGYDMNPEIFKSMEDDEHESFLNFARDMTYPRGFKVKVAHDKVDRAIAILKQRGGDPRTMEALRAVGDRVLEVETIIFRSRDDIAYKFVGSDVPYSGFFIEDARPHEHLFGVVMEYEDRIFAVELDGVSDHPVALKAVEILGGVERAFGGYWDIDTISGLKDVLAEIAKEETLAGRGYPALSGEFTIADTGMETWCLSGQAWTSGITPAEIDACTAKINELLASAPCPN